MAGWGDCTAVLELPLNAQLLCWKAELQDTGEVNGLAVDGLDQERVTAYARHFLEHYSLPGAVHLNLRSSIPAHVGLGSGTQLALAVGSTLAQLGGFTLSATELS